MLAVTKGWPPARRAAQAENARRTRPWLCATGPKTPQGKARTRLNAQKHGFRNAEWRTLYAALRAQRRFLKLVKPLLNPDLSPQEFQTLKTAIMAGSAYESLQLYLHNLTYSQPSGIHSGA